MKMKIIRNKTEQNLFAEIENFYLNHKYYEIINLKGIHADTNFFDSEKEHYCKLSEIFSISYIELGFLKKALVIINEYLHYLNKNGISTEDDFDDLATFYLMKIEIYDKRNCLVNRSLH